MNKRFKYENNKLILPLFTILIIIISSVRLFNDSISGDEGFSLMLIQMDLPGLITATAADVHPPLYYLLLKVFATMFGFDAITGRVFSFVAVLLTAILGNTYIERSFGKRTAFLFIGLTLFTKTGIDMNVEIRMYFWSMLFVTITALFAYELLKEKKLYKWIGLTTFGLAAAYMHYYALITVAFLFASLFVMLIIKDRKNVIPCIACAVISIIAYFPWLLILVKQFGSVSKDYWISNIEVKEWIRYIYGNNRFGRMLRVLLGAVSVLYLFTKNGLFINKEIHVREKSFIRFDWETNKLLSEDRLLFLLCAIASIGTLTTGVIVSYLFRPLYVERYLFPAMGLISLAFAIAFDNVSRKKIYTIIFTSFLLFFGIISSVKLYQDEKDNKTEECKSFFHTNLQDEDVFITDNMQLSWTVLRYYFPEHSNYYYSLFELEDDFNGIIWYMGDTNDIKDINEKLVYLIEEGLTVKYVGEMGIGRYPFYLYKIER